MTGESKSLNILSVSSPPSPAGDVSPAPPPPPPSASHQHLTITTVTINTTITQPSALAREAWHIEVPSVHLFVEQVGSQFNLKGFTARTSSVHGALSEPGPEPSPKGAYHEDLNEEGREEGEQRGRKEQERRVGRGRREGGRKFKASWPLSVTQSGAWGFSKLNGRSL